MSRLKSFLALLLLGLSSLVAQEAPWRSLFMGDLSAFETWLGRPHRSDSIEGLARDPQTGNYLENVGLNRDPVGVYSVVQLEGEPAIRISGRMFGALTTKAEFENYHLTLAYRWGDKKWAPRDQAPLDSGLLYHCVGEHGRQNNAWMLSQELQIWEGEVGDFYSVGGGTVDMPAVRPDPAGHYVYTPGAPLVQFGPWDSRYTPQKLNPNPTRANRLGNVAHDHVKDWNRVDLYVLGDTSVHVVNGKVVMVLFNSRLPLPDRGFTPLTRGRLQLQSEGAEIFYRDIRWRPLEAFPLEAAHIRPFGEQGPHLVSNGLLLRSDLHHLFDQGYLTVSLDHRVEVSQRIREEFQNGRHYYALHGEKLAVLPDHEANRPRAEFLERHHNNCYKAS